MVPAAVAHFSKCALGLCRGSCRIAVFDALSAIGFSIGRTEATKLLSRWTRQGWLRRVAPGAYAAAQLESLESEQVLDDPWVLVPALYGPAYVGGWSAAEHWDLTEQIFRQILVMTMRPVRERHQTRHGTQFILRHIQERRLFGTKPVWRSRSRVPVSDVHRTVIDLLDDPSVGGGIQHVTDCLMGYLRHKYRDDDLLITPAGSATVRYSSALASWSRAIVAPRLWNRLARHD